ncbi:MAG: potassium transporter Kup, partial [Candidatus Dadabacteria bacterium]
VVYGDIGTSPLYAFRECFAHVGGLPVTPENVLGVLSLIFWSLVLVISVKYLVLVMQADNRGEGGILALMTLVLGAYRRDEPLRRTILVLGIFGAALLYGDGVITPAISVLSAVEGLSVATPVFDPYVVPIAVAILFGLFLIQRQGTGRVGNAFGPVTLAWFLCMAALGLPHIAEAPQVARALSPLPAVSFFARNGLEGLRVLGAVFLVVTGGEALYADMGHFGARPIRLAWFALVLPSLVLNYFGQGALLLRNPAAARNPFYLMAPSWSLYPLVGLATAATVIASQAVISGAFSLTRQAVLLGYLPRVEIRHTSAQQVGQVYVPIVNGALLALTLAATIGFGSSSALSGAYGVAVTTTMVITTILLFFCMRRRWGWSLLRAAGVVSFLLVIDLAFFAANMTKLFLGGWFPLVIAGAVFAIISTWRQGRRQVAERLAQGLPSLDYFVRDLKEHPIPRVPGTAVFLVSDPRQTPQVLMHNIKHNKVVHEQVVVLTIVTEEVPRVPESERFDIEMFEEGVIRIVAHYGFMETPAIPAILRRALPPGAAYRPEQTTYFLGRETIVLGPDRSMSRWRKRLFSLLLRLQREAVLHFGIPTNRVVELGRQVKL